MRSREHSAGSFVPTAALFAAAIFSCFAGKLPFSVPPDFHVGQVVNLRGTGSPGISSLPSYAVVAIVPRSEPRQSHRNSVARCPAIRFGQAPVTVAGGG